VEEVRTTVDFATPEDVPLRFELAGAGTRILAAMVDQLIILMLEAGLLMFALVVGILIEEIGETDVEQWTEQMQSGGPTLTLLGLSLLAAFVVNFGYYVFMELTTNGQTVGKRMLGIRTIREGGYGLTFTASLLRNLGRLIDMVPNTYFVGMVVMVVHPREKRVGDMLAGTVVVRERTRSSAGLPFGDQRYSTLAERRYHLDREVLGPFGEEHEQVLAKFFSRPRLIPEQERRLVQAISDGFASSMAEPPTFETHRDRLLLLKELYLALRERRELG